MPKNRDQIAIDTQIEKHIMQMIYDTVFVGLEDGKVKLHYVDDVAEKIRKYFQSMYEADPTATFPDLFTVKEKNEKE